jgi:hypothetical protein
LTARRRRETSSTARGPRERRGTAGGEEGRSQLPRGEGIEVRWSVIDAAAAADAAAALRVEEQLGNHLKVLENVKEEGVDAWTKQLEQLADMADWPTYLLSLTEQQPAKEADPRQKKRR